MLNFTFSQYPPKHSDDAPYAQAVAIYPVWPLLTFSIKSYDRNSILSAQIARRQFFHHPIQFQYLQYHFLADGLNVFPRTEVVWNLKHTNRRQQKNRTKCGRFLKCFLSERNMENFQTASKLKRPSENLFNNRGGGNSQSKGFYNHLNIGYTRQTLFFLLSLDHHHFLH